MIGERKVVEIGQLVMEHSITKQYLITKRVGISSMHPLFTVQSKTVLLHFNVK